jgi:hypothetical protein
MSNTSIIIDAPVIFNGTAKNNVVLSKPAVFNDAAVNEASVINAVFNGTATNAVGAQVRGKATFSDSAVNAGKVYGDAIFKGNASTTGTIYGDIVCDNPSAFTGKVNGNIVTRVAWLSDGSDAEQLLKTYTAPPNNYSVTQSNQGGGIYSPVFPNDTYLTTKDTKNSELRFGDFTIEFYIKPDGAGTNQMILASFPGYDEIYPQSYLEIKFVTSNKLTAYGLYSEAAGDITLSANTWHHVAYVCEGRSLRIYVDGVRYFKTENRKLTIVRSFKIGNRKYTTQNGFTYPYKLTSKLTGLRITKSAVYTKNFQPSATPLAALDDTILLLNFGSTAMPSISAPSLLNGYYSDGYYVDNNITLPPGAQNGVLLHAASNESEAANRKYYRYTATGANIATGLVSLGNGEYQYFGPNPQGSTAFCYNCVNTNPGCTTESLGITSIINIKPRDLRRTLHTWTSISRTTYEYYDWGFVGDNTNLGKWGSGPGGTIVSCVYAVLSDRVEEGPKFWEISKQYDPAHPNDAAYATTVAQLYTGATNLGLVVAGVLVAGDNRAYQCTTLDSATGVLHGGYASYYYPRTGAPYPLQGLHYIVDPRDTNNTTQRWIDYSGLGVPTPVTGKCLAGYISNGQIDTTYGSPTYKTNTAQLADGLYYTFEHGLPVLAQGVTVTNVYPEVLYFLEDGYQVTGLSIGDFYHPVYFPEAYVGPTGTEGLWGTMNSNGYVTGVSGAFSFGYFQNGRRSDYGDRYTNGVRAYDDYNYYKYTNGYPTRVIV